MSRRVISRHWCNRPKCTEIGKKQSMSEWRPRSNNEYNISEPQAEAMCSSVFWPGRQPHYSGSKGVRRFASMHFYSRAVIGSDFPILGKFQRRRQSNLDGNFEPHCLAVGKTKCYFCSARVPNGWFSYDMKWTWFHIVWQSSRRHVKKLIETSCSMLFETSLASKIPLLVLLPISPTSARPAHPDSSERHSCHKKSKLLTTWPWLWHCSHCFLDFQVQCRLIQ